jgi:hypothetical protein
VLALALRPIGVASQRQVAPPHTKAGMCAHRRR